MTILVTVRTGLLEIVAGRTSMLVTIVFYAMHLNPNLTRIRSGVGVRHQRGLRREDAK